ncbi:MAG: cation diffusion facilitator family transporter [Halanaeroarchaeum sp.]
MADDRTAFLKASWVNVGGNVAKILVEGTIGVAFGSIALVADAAHSLADLLASVVVLVWGRLTFEGPDAGHPHGHERVEPLTALFVGATLVALAIKILWDAATALREGPQVVYSPMLPIGLAIAIALMVGAYWYTERINRDVGSPALDALARDARNDVLTSFAAVVGVFGAAVGRPILDPVAGALVSVLVLKEGVEIARENVDYLTGSAPPEDDLDRIRAAIRGHGAVRGIHDMRCHYVGTSIEVEFHAEIDGDYTLREAHDIETEIRDRVRDLAQVGDVHVHLDPSGVGEWKDAAESGDS